MPLDTWEPVEPARRDGKSSDGFTCTFIIWCVVRWPIWGATVRDTLAISYFQETTRRLKTSLQTSATGHFGMWKSGVKVICICVQPCDKKIVKNLSRALCLQANMF